MVQTLRANLSLGWPPQLSNNLKEAAKLESDTLCYLFSNSQDFLSKAITVFMDESFGRDNMMKFFKMINTATPFLIMNDYRVAKANSSLMRVEILTRVLKEL